MMPQKEKIEKLAQTVVESLEDLGEKAGSSGHLGFKSYIIDSIEQTSITKDQESPKFRIKVSYRIIIETEFTYYPDNPPHEYAKSTSFFVDDHSELLQSDLK